MSLYLGTDLVAGNQDVSNFVEKTGDTMTGVLGIKRNNLHISLGINGFTKGTTPTSDKYCSIYINDDRNDPTEATLSSLGYISYTADTSGNSILNVSVIKNEANSLVRSTLNLKVAADGTKSCSFPDTVRCDGQYVEASSTVASGVSLNGSTNLSYTLSDVPNDGKNHMVCLIATVTTGTTSGNNIMAQITSTLCPGGMNVSRAITRTSSNMSGTGTCWIPVGADRKITLNRSTSYNGTCNLYMRGYRRIGDNS